MTTKGPPQYDAKTIPVGTPQRSTPANRPQPPDDGRTKFITETQAGWSDEGKTAYVKMEDEAASAHQGGPTPSDKGGIRSGPSPRLPWPARDQQRGRAGSQGNEDSAINQDAADGQSDDEPSTQLFSPGAAKSGVGGAANKASSAGQGQFASTREDPVVGWLVIVQGPGKGNSVEIGIGANPIGRDRSQKICLDYGDQQIHREKHAVLVYDPRSRRFFLQCGDVRNLTYLGEDLVLTPAELKGGETIVMGQTSGSLCSILRT